VALLDVSAWLLLAWAEQRRQALLPITEHERTIAEPGIFASTSFSTLRSTPGIDISPAWPLWPEPRITTEAPTSRHRRRSLGMRPVALVIVV
jgi:hypothetical protein